MLNKIKSLLGLNPLSQLKKASKTYHKSSNNISKHAPNAAAEIDAAINRLDVARSAALDVKSFVLDLHDVAKTTTKGLTSLTKVK